MSLVVTPVPPFPGLNDWAQLISFRPPELIQAGVNGRFGRRACHAIEEAKGPINLDYYPVRVSALPSGTRSGKELLEKVRRMLNAFIDHKPDGCVFNPYEQLVDKPAWEPPFFQLGFPGAVLSIDIWTSIPAGSINAEDGSVVLSEWAEDHWVFSTMWTPNDLTHPVSGNRQFGFFPIADGEFIFYTRGADRLTTWIDEMLGELAFSGAHKLWSSFQRRLTSFIQDNGGKAKIEVPVSNRYDWETVKSSYFKPLIPWVA